MNTSIYNLISLILILFIAGIVVADKTKANAKDKKFRTTKYNEIWKRALKKLSKEDLETLGKVLYKLDKTALNLKHQKETGEGYDKRLEATLRDHLASVLEQYNLFDGASKKDFEGVTFKDARLNTMWMQAFKEAHYSADDLATLHQELKHMEEKITDYQKLSEKVAKHEQGVNSAEKNDKVLFESTDSGEANIETKSAGFEKLKTLKNELKDKYHELDEKVKTIEQNVLDRVNTPGSKFIDPRVRELWDHARRSGNFKHEELESIKEELGHFQSRIDKQNHWKQLNEKLHKSVHEDGYHTMNEEYEQSKEKFNEHKKYVKKYHATMLDRIYHHNEL